MDILLLLLVGIAIVVLLGWKLIKFTIKLLVIILLILAIIAILRFFPMVKIFDTIKNLFSLLHL